MRATVSQKYDDKVNAARSSKNPEFKPTEFVSRPDEDLNWSSKARTTPKPHALKAYESCPLLTLRYEKHKKLKTDTKRVLLCSFNTY